VGGKCNAPARSAASVWLRSWACRRRRLPRLGAKLRLLMGRRAAVAGRLVLPLATGVVVTGQPRRSVAIAGRVKKYSGWSVRELQNDFFR
jgi:hypothetical protein